MQFPCKPALLPTMGCSGQFSQDTPLTSCFTLDHPSFSAVFHFRAAQMPLTLKSPTILPGEMKGLLHVPPSSSLAPLPQPFCKEPLNWKPWRTDMSYLFPEGCLVPNFAEQNMHSKPVSGMNTHKLK